MAADEAGLPAGTECTALYHQDGGWYDAVIVKALPQGKYQVNFVEYGNMEEVTADEIRLSPSVVRAMATELAQAKAQLSELKDASEGFAKMENAYKVQLGALESRVSDLKQRLAEKERAGGDGASKAKVDQLQKEVQMAIKAREALMEEAELRKQLVESLEERTRKQKDRIDELEAERMTMQQQQIIAFRELQTKLHEAEDKLRAKEKDFEELLGRGPVAPAAPSPALQAAQAAAKTASARAAELESELDGVRGQLSELVERESRSGRELQRLRAEQEAQENKVLELEVARDKALAEMQEAELARSKLEKQVGVLKAQVEKLRGEDKAGEFQAQVADLKKRLEEKDAAIAIVQEQLDTAQRTVKKQKRELDQAKESLQLAAKEVAARDERLAATASAAPPSPVAAAPGGPQTPFAVQDSSAELKASERALREVNEKLVAEIELREKVESERDKAARALATRERDLVELRAQAESAARQLAAKDESFERTLTAAAEDNDRKLCELKAELEREHRAEIARLERELALRKEALREGGDEEKAKATEGLIQKLSAAEQRVVELEAELKRVMAAGRHAPRGAGRAAPAAPPRKPAVPVMKRVSRGGASPAGGVAAAPAAALSASAARRMSVSERLARAAERRRAMRNAASADLEERLNRAAQERDGSERRDSLPRSMRPTQASAARERRAREERQRRDHTAGEEEKPPSATKTRERTRRLGDDAVLEAPSLSGVEAVVDTHNPLKLIRREPKKIKSERLSWNPKRRPLYEPPQRSRHHDSEGDEESEDESEEEKAPRDKRASPSRHRRAGSGQKQHLEPAAPTSAREGDAATPRREGRPAVLAAKHAKVASVSEELARFSSEHAAELRGLQFESLGGGEFRFGSARVALLLMHGKLFVRHRGAVTPIADFVDRFARNEAHHARERTARERREASRAQRAADRALGIESERKDGAALARADSGDEEAAREPARTQAPPQRTLSPHKQPQPQPQPQPQQQQQQPEQESQPPAQQQQQPQQQQQQPEQESQPPAQQQQQQQQQQPPRDADTPPLSPTAATRAGLRAEDLEDSESGPEDDPMLARPLPETGESLLDDL